MIGGSKGSKILSGIKSIIKSGVLIGLGGIIINYYNGGGTTEDDVEGATSSPIAMNEQLVGYAGITLGVLYVLYAIILFIMASVAQ